MAFDINNMTNLRPPEIPDIKLSKATLDLFVGQVLRAIVVGTPNNNEVVLNINGQNVNAKTPQQFLPGDLLEVKVSSTADEIILEIQQKALSSTALQKYALQSALLQVLPKQAPPTNLLDNLNQLVQSGKLPGPINQQVKALLGSIIPLAQLPDKLMQAIEKSGVFMESSLANWQKGMPIDKLQADFKAQYLKLLDNLPAPLKDNLLLPSMRNNQLKQDALPLPGAVPQPLHKDTPLNLQGLSTETIKDLLHEQVSQVLSRITANQITHLSQENPNGFLMMLDLPIKIGENIDVIPLKIEEQEKSPESEEESKWSISFALSLSELGDMQATLSLNGDNLDIKINSERADTVAILQSSQAEMEDLIHELGLKLRNFNMGFGLENNHIDASNIRLLDIRI